MTTAELRALVAKYQHLQTTPDERDTARRALATSVPELLDRLEAAERGAARWRKVADMMTHEHSGPHVGWTLSVLLPGDDPDAAIDAVWSDDNA